VAPSLAGPKRPQDRIEIGDVASKFDELFTASVRPTASTSRPTSWAAPPRGLWRRELATDAPPPKPGAPRAVVEMVGNRPTLETARQCRATAVCALPGSDDKCCASATATC
jgi:aconitate hydratase